MSWSYSGDPSSSDRDSVRFLIGDTDSSDEQLSNEEINWILTQEPNTYLAGHMAAQIIAGRYARLVDKSVGDLRISYSQRQKTYFALAEALVQQAMSNSGLAAPYAGGISVSDKQLVESNTDRVQPSFKKGMHDYYPSAPEDPDWVNK